MRINLHKTHVSIILLLLTNFSFAQKKTINNDFSGSIKKYNRYFSGTGPEVYFLPAPRTKEEVLEDNIKKMQLTFDELIPFDDTIQTGILYHNLSKSFQLTANTDKIREYINTKAINHKNWHQLKPSSTEIADNLFTTELLNELAYVYILKKETDKAEQLLIKAIEHNDETINSEQNDILKDNLIALYLYNKKYDSAIQLEDRNLPKKNKVKSTQDQIDSILKIAKIESYKNNLKVAEDLILKKVLHLANRSKDNNNKINTWVELADIYRYNKKYTEAQWFLLQAKQLSEEHNITKYNNKIDYLLGYSKFNQKNYIHAQDEVESAMQGANKDNNEYMLLSTLQMLGEINLKRGKLDEATSFLNSYWNLRNKLFLN